MTNGAAAAIMLTDLIEERPNPWLGTFDANRFKPLASATKLLKETVSVGAHFFGDRLSGPDLRSLDELAPGEGALVAHDGDTVAAHREEDGTVHAVSPVCTHLYCHVNWNAAERSWDCPCHGSRFAPDGTVLQGPAVKPLERKELAGG
jgi:nitrite reductase/ring-hydroxylating ferredoxin subunit